MGVIRYRQSHSFDITYFHQPLGKEQVLGQAVSRLIYIGIDLMGNKIAGLCGESDSDVTAYLTNPDMLTFEFQGGYPESEMIALMNGTACLLQGNVLFSFKQVQGAYR